MATSITFSDIYTDFIDDFLPTVSAGISNLLGVLGQTLGNLAERLGFSADVIPGGIREVTLFSAVLGAGISVVILYTLVKWVLGVLG